jgi:hypothetical protein
LVAAVYLGSMPSWSSAVPGVGGPRLGDPKHGDPVFGAQRIAKLQLGRYRLLGLDAELELGGPMLGVPTIGGPELTT